MPTESLNDRLADVLTDPSRVNLRKFVRQNFGETNNCDFKVEWPEGAKLAKHVLAIANSGGGAILVGFKEDNLRMEPVGVAAPLDPTDLLNRIDRYIPNQLQSELKPLTISYDQSEHQPLVGKTFQILVVPDLPRFIPFMPQRASGDMLRELVYVRRNASTVVARYEDLQAIINRRLENGIITTIELDLDQHLEQLKVLYQHVMRTIGGGWIPNGFTTALNAFSSFTAGGEYIQGEPNPHYPPQSKDAFISRMIQAKKRRIEMTLDVSGITSEPVAKRSTEASGISNPDNREGVPSAKSAE